MLMIVLLDKQKLLSSHQSQESGRITQKVYSSFWEETKPRQITTDFICILPESAYTSFVNKYMGIYEKHNAKNAFIYIFKEYDWNKDKI